MARHAHALEDKLARRQAILDAARQLFVAGAGELPTVLEIAGAAGLAKGTLYLYFRTREEIFCELILQLWLDMLGEIGAAFETAKGPRSAKVAAYIDHLLEYLATCPEILRLDALAYSLERNVDPDVRREQNLRFAAQLGDAGARADVALRLPAGRSVQIMMRSYALMRGLWQMTHQQQQRSGAPSGAPSDPILAQLFPDFEPTLREALKEYWRGALGGG